MNNECFLKKREQARRSARTCSQVDKEYESMKDDSLYYPSSRLILYGDEH